MKVSVTTQCPFPVGCIFDAAKALFETVVPAAIHQKAIENGLERCLSLHVDWVPIRDVAEIDGSNKIHLHANFCQFLWMLNYITLVLCDCSQLKDGTQTDEEISPEIAAKMFEEALYMQKLALHMFIPKDNNSVEMLTNRGELFSFPNPYTKKNKYTELADALTVSGIAYLLQHEYAHFIKEHIESTPLNEEEADKHAFEKILEWGKHQPVENVALTGPMMALVATAFLNPKLVGTTHPDIDNRIASLFDTFNYICKHPIPEGACQLLVAVIAFWSYAHKLLLPTPNKNEIAISYLCRIRKDYILPIKRKYKVI